MAGEEGCVPLVQIHVGFLADEVRVPPSDTFDLGQGVHDLLLAVDVGVEETEDELEVGLFARDESWGFHQHNSCQSVLPYRGRVRRGGDFVRLTHDGGFDGRVSLDAVVVVVLMGDGGLVESALWDSFASALAYGIGLAPHTIFYTYFPLEPPP